MHKKNSNDYAAAPAIIIIVIWNNFNQRKSGWDTMMETGERASLRDITEGRADSESNWVPKNIPPLMICCTPVTPVHGPHFPFTSPPLRGDSQTGRQAGRGERGGKREAGDDDCRGSRSTWSADANDNNMAASSRRLTR